MTEGKAAKGKTEARLIEALKPCPFCGGKAERITLGDDEPDNAGGDVITCTRCQASSHVEFGFKENLVSRWNARACEEWRALSELADAVQLEADGEFGISGQLSAALNDVRAILEWDA